MAEEKSQLGYQLPLYRSLTEQVLIAGAPKSVIVVNAMIMGIFILSLQFFWILPMNLLIHFGAIYISRHDEQFFDCFLRYIKAKDYYCT
ncbi:VirB3 family type IV secretion system protein [Anaerospora hongkongensis]|uniref:VirB3 family type IV secretion system protein n=1 Tax=Anaerospora hongkongensis TaxID=244830 RepID=UPI002FD88020